MIVTAIAIAICAALVDYFFGIKDPWKKIIYIGCVVLLILGIILLVFPGLFAGLRTV